MDRPKDFVDLKHGELDVRLDYIKLAQWVKATRHFIEKIERELDIAGKRAGLKIEERRQCNDRRNNAE